MTSEQLQKLNSYIKNEIASHRFGQIDISIKVKNGKAVYVNRGFSEGLKLDSETRSTGNHYDDKQ